MTDPNNFFIRDIFFEHAYPPSLNYMEASIPFPHGDTLFPQILLENVILIGY